MQKMDGSFQMSIDSKRHLIFKFFTIKNAKDGKGSMKWEKRPKWSRSEKGWKQKIKKEEGRRDIALKHSLPLTASGFIRKSPPGKTNYQMQLELDWHLLGHATISIQPLMIQLDFHRAADIPYSTFINIYLYININTISTRMRFAYIFDSICWKIILSITYSRIHLMSPSKIISIYHLATLIYSPLNF